ncbi:MAG: PSD1 and planctomycete cytochrome C domain-containing protein [Planctomycetota bacterium]
MSLITAGVFLLFSLAGLAFGDEIDFNSQVRPILSRHCISCHGPDEEAREADFRLDTREGALVAIDLEDVENSEMMFRIRSSEEDRMPPLEHSQGLSKSEIEIIRRWIDQGAEYAKHWSFVKPKKVDPPPVNTQWKAWVRSPIDQFIIARQSANGLPHSDQAQPETLIRRLSLDLTGLPPEPEMVDRFRQDPTDQTYELLVDELLASSAYGEHWAAMWLDLARYADTFGYASDNARTIWPWRDWVIDAFNANLSYKQFTIDQLAGDLLPNPTDQQLLATAFHRNTLNNTEGGTSNEEFRVVAVKDRVSTTMNVWMGLTMRCAECHTHKYDPITQREYYQFYDFFNQTEDADTNNDHPVRGFLPRLDRPVKIPDLDWAELNPIEAESSSESELQILEDGSVVARGINPEFDTYTVEYDLKAGRLSGFRLEVLPDLVDQGNVGRHPNGSFALTQIRAWLVDESGSKQEIKFSAGEADYNQSGHRFDKLIARKPDKVGWAVGSGPGGYRGKRTGVLSLKRPLDIQTASNLVFELKHDSHWPLTNISRFKISRTSDPRPAEGYYLIVNGPRRVNVPVMKEKMTESRRKTHLMIRGSYLQPGEEVTSGVPQAFHPFPESLSRDRLGVALWLMSDQNPLTARVAVNRFWARLFGKGIVETEEDFGTQGTYPTHPELLDWLAVDFKDNGWDIKRLLKQMVTSSTYRQSGIATAEMLNRDPRNIYLTRGPRVRLSAETIRDQALAVSGLLSDKKYGPPVYPPNPIKEVKSAFAGSTVWKESRGEDRYRRAIYTYLKRTSPHPLFDTFDMSTREVCSLRRVSTNTPLQSFMTLNDATFVEAARAMAKKMDASSPHLSNQIRTGYEEALFKAPSKRQVETLVSLYQSTVSGFESSPESARQLLGLSPGEGDVSGNAKLATLTVVANVILNLDAFLTK